MLENLPDAIGHALRDVRAGLENTAFNQSGLRTGLAGEVRPAPRGQERLKEAAKLGFSVAVVPKANAPKKPIEGLTIHAVERVEQAIEVLRGLV